MNLTCASSYALHAVVFMARQKTDAPIASHKIAEALDMPDRFLLKVLHPLVEANLLESIKGPKGGYKLARPADEISVLAIVEGVDGAIDGKLPKTKMPSHSLDHKLRDICDESADAVRATLEKFHVADLVSASRQPTRRKAKGA
jgi:Rrf2 family transcriptional regulator, iron-sulfur cluster assembly transcription factor